MKVTDVFLVLSQRGGGGLHPDLNEQMLRAVRSVLLCLTELTDCDARDDGGQLGLLQQEVTGPFQLHVPTPS